MPNNLVKHGDKDGEPWVTKQREGRDSDLIKF